MSGRRNVLSDARQWLGGWRTAALLIAGLTLVPLAVVFASVFEGDAGIWRHLLQYVLPELFWNTIWLALGVAATTAVLGVSLAWLTAVYEFPGRRWFAWALMLPLAMPAYVAAFVDIGLYDFTGPLQSALRAWTGGPVWFPAIRSRGGVIAVMSLSLYPYVYLLARNAFTTQGRRALEVGQSLGLTRLQGFFRVVLPATRPWLAAGVLLVLMESLADFGTVAVFNYDAFTTAIYKAWFGLFSLSAAAQLASVLVVLVFVLVLAEQYGRGQRRYEPAGKSGQARYRLRRGPGVAAALYAWTVLLLAFIVPLCQLLYWCGTTLAEEMDARYPLFITHSVLLAGLAALAVAAAALVLAYSARLYQDWPTRLLARLATLGYAIPGTVLAVGVFVPVAWLDARLAPVLHAWGWLPAGAGVLRGTVLVMLLAYVARFLAPGFHSIESAMQRITRSQDEAARSMGYRGWKLFRHVHIPLLRGGVLGAILMVFVDVMKEMPITLMTRPFGWDTLAVRVFEMTSEGQWERAALPAVTLVLAGLLPVMLLTRQAERE